MEYFSASVMTDAMSLQIIHQAGEAALTAM